MRKRSKVTMYELQDGVSAATATFAHADEEVRKEIYFLFHSFFCFLKAYQGT